MSWPCSHLKMEILPALVDGSPALAKLRNPNGNGVLERTAWGVGFCSVSLHSWLFLQLPPKPMSWGCQEGLVGIEDACGVREVAWLSGGTFPLTQPCLFHSCTP